MAECFQTDKDSNPRKISQFNDIGERLLTRYRLSHGGNTGSSPVGSAKDFKHLAKPFRAGSKMGPIYGSGLNIDDPRCVLGFRVPWSPKQGEHQTRPDDATSRCSAGACEPVWRAVALRASPLASAF